MRGNQAEKNSRVAVCNYIFFFFFFCLHGQKCEDLTYCTALQETEFYVRVHTDHNEVFHILLLVNSKCITDLLVKLFFLCEHSTGMIQTKKVTNV